MQKLYHQQRREVDKINEQKRKRQSMKKTEKVVAKYSRAPDGTRVKREVGDDFAEDSDEETPHEALLPLTQRMFVDYLRAHDVIITTYNELQDDLNVAAPAPPRSRRSNAAYKPDERPRSPLVMVEWWRVIMDEVQLCGDSSKAANMVALIPRKNSLAVSGTPAKGDIKDLMGSFRFLRVPTLPYNNRLWHRLQQPSLRPAFQGLCKSLAIRTTKKEVQGEFNIPQQTRVVVPIELSDIEVAYYQDTLERQRTDLHIPEDPTSMWAGVFEVDRAKLRTALVTLRQICTHIQVGQMQGVREGPRLHLGRELMTMHEALAKMQNDHNAELMNESRAQMRAMIRKAQLTMLAEEDDHRHLRALALLERARAKASSQMVSVQLKLDQLLSERRRAAHDGSVLSDDHTDDMTPERNLSQAERAKRVAIQTARSHIREVSIILHETWFFEGDIRHQLNEEAAEVLAYQTAEGVRRDLLKRPLQISNSSIKLLRDALERTQTIGLSDLRAPATKIVGGIETAAPVASCNELLEILNGNALLVHNWRQKIVDLLSTPVESDSGELAAVGKGQDVENPEAEFYAQALKAQGEVEAYLMAYSAALADRKEFLLEERSLLAEHDSRQKKQRETRAALNAAAEAAPELADVPDDVQEQAGELMKERRAFRDARELKDCEQPLKAYLLDLNGIVHGGGRPEERAIAQEMANLIKQFIKQQTEHFEKLNKELDLFRQTFNRRVIYFAALQEISDSVSAPVVQNLEEDIQTSSHTIDQLEAKLARMAVKGRFLDYLGSKENIDEEIREDCIICMGSSADEKAVLLECGHFFCLSCYLAMRTTVQGRKCPSCRQPINRKNITRVKLANTGVAANDRPPEAQESMALQSLSPEVAKEPELSYEERERIKCQEDLEKLRMMDQERMLAVSHMDVFGEFGSKINFLIKHILYYRAQEPDARHVIFSNWHDSLKIVIRALETNRIKCVAFDQGDKTKDVVDRFLKDQTITVFLLHAERESAGLTLTSCRVVHLLEPVLKHSFELQAIGRVDRLGQSKETTVYCYATMDTVESRILSQGVRNRTSIYLKDDTSDDVVAGMENVVSAAHKGGDVSDGSSTELLSLFM